MILLQLIALLYQDKNNKQWRVINFSWRENLSPPVSLVLLRVQNCYIWQNTFIGHYKYRFSTRFARVTHGERSEEFSRRWWDQAVYCCETASPWNAFNVCFYYTYISMCDGAMVHNTLPYNRYLLRLMRRSKSDKAQSRLPLLRQWKSLSLSLFLCLCFSL